MGGRTVFDEMSQGQSYTNPFDYLALELSGVYIMQNNVRGDGHLGEKIKKNLKWKKIVCFLSVKRPLICIFLGYKH